MFLDAFCLAIYTCTLDMAVGVWNIQIITPDAENLVLRMFYLCIFLFVRMREAHMIFRFCALVNKTKNKVCPTKQTIKH